jgi:hypothetical protein
MTDYQKQEQAVASYLHWLATVEADLREHVQNVQLRLKNINRKMTKTPVW